MYYLFYNKVLESRHRVYNVKNVYIIYARNDNDLLTKILNLDNVSIYGILEIFLRFRGKYFRDSIKKILVFIIITITKFFMKEKK
jgi:hypothetical protein